MGNPRKPTRIKQLEGNRGKRKLNQNEPQPPVVVAPDAPPEWLSKLGKAAWNSKARELIAYRVLTSWDYETLAAWCNAYAEWREADEKLKTELPVLVSDKTGYTYPNPWVAIRRNSRREMVRIGGLLGLNPADRSRLNVDTTQKDGKSEAEEMIGY
jgi:P27 family predicted phage terminase small subunit